MAQVVWRLVALLVLAWNQMAWAESDARDYLDKMSHSFRELDYRGVFTYEYGSHIESLQVVHVVRNGVEKERLIYLDGESREIIRDGHELSCVHPGHQLLRLGSRAVAGPFVGSSLELQDISSFYVLAMGEPARIADREAVQVLVQPKDPYRYGRRLYLDRDTALLLKSLTVNSAGKILERYQFSHSDIGAVIDDSELLAAGNRGHRAHHHVLEQVDDASAKEVGFGVPEPQWLPPGFVLSARSGGQQNARPVQMSMYTDGFSTLTLILESGPDQIPSDGRARQGATVAYMRQLTFHGESYLLTVVGEVPLLTARKVARSVTINGA